MVLFISIELLLICLALLWMPTCAVAQFFTRAGDRSARKALLIILPAQFALTYILTYAGLAIGLSNASQTFVMTALAVSVIGVLTSIVVHHLEQF